MKHEEILSVNSSSSGKYATATITYYSGPEITVEISSNGSWRFSPRGNTGNPIFSSPYATSLYSNTFDAEDGDKYVLQVYCPVDGTYYGSFDGSGFTVDFSDDSGDSGESSDVTARTLYVNQGEGTKLHIMRSSPDYRECYDDLKTGAPVYCDGEDTFYVEVEVLNGYELDYYDVEGMQVPYTLDNFVYLRTSSSDPNRHYYQLEYDMDASITSTATPIATVRIYNKDASDFSRYAPYIYRENSGWERYSPYIYSENSGWERYN